MLITYFDEVKFQPPHQRFQWLAGLVVDGTLVGELEAQAGEIAEELFGSAALTKETEFHAVDIFHGKANCKGWEIERRLGLLKRLIGLIDRRGEVLKVYARLEPARMVASNDLPERTFMFFVERVDALVGAKNTVGLLIGDYDEDRFATKAARELSLFRRAGTPYQYGVKIEALVDTVHFTKSHLSRMLQLADVYTWCLQLCHSPPDDKYPRRVIEEFVRSSTSLLWADKFKEWPTANSWVQPGSG